MTILVVLGNWALIFITAMFARTLTNISLSALSLCEFFACNIVIGYIWMVSPVPYYTMSATPSLCLGKKRTRTLKHFAHRFFSANDIVVTGPKTFFFCQSLRAMSIVLLPFVMRRNSAHMRSKNHNVQSLYRLLSNHSIRPTNLQWNFVQPWALLDTHVSVSVSSCCFYAELIKR